MFLPFTDKKLSCISGCLISVIGLFTIPIIISAGAVFSEDVSILSTLVFTVVVLAGLIGLLKLKIKKNPDKAQIFLERKNQLNHIAHRYNEVIDCLYAEFELRTSRKSARHAYPLYDSYSDRYDDIKKEFCKEADAFSMQWASTHKRSQRLKNAARRIIYLGFIVILGGCSFSFGILNPDLGKSPEELNALMENHSWSANNIPMPHITNGDLYVSDPDSILSATTVRGMNQVLSRLDHELDIESAFIIVGHIENDDPVGMVRGVYDKYKVGRQDRGLVVVVGYLDHSYFIAPGKSLEADLTDLECNHLARNYLIPSMKAEMPDSGMLYLAKGVYALLSQKDMPRMAPLSSPQNDDFIEDEDIGPLTIIAFFVIMVAWLIYGTWLFSKQGWSNNNYAGLKSNPFIPVTSSGSGSYGSSSSFGSSGSSGSSGGYGGGSWGGGGSGGRW